MTQNSFVEFKKDGVSSEAEVLSDSLLKNLNEYTNLTDSSTQTLTISSTTPTKQKKNNLEN